MLLQKSDIVYRDGVRYIVILADDELCCVAPQEVGSEGEVITDYYAVEVYDNNNKCRLEDYKFEYGGNADKDIIDVIIEEMASEE